jgi:hypothetical protein
LGVFVLLLLFWVLLLLLLGRCLLCFVWHSGLLGHGYKKFRGQTMSCFRAWPAGKTLEHKSAAVIQSDETVIVLTATLSAADTD